jgi:hypothetical protein
MYAQSTKPRLNCLLCGKEFSRSPAFVRRSKLHFCSRTCATAHAVASMPTLEDRFWTRVDRNTGGCWAWLGPKNPTSGYGTVKASGKSTYAHRVAYTLTHGPIPDGLVIDHLCRNPVCVNPDHLEVVTHRENVLRGIGPAARNARKTHCKHGHPFDEGNTYTDKRGQRHCRSCARGRQE